jgi:hypothetical protein
MVGHQPDGAVRQDVDDATTHALPAGQVDIEGVAWPPSRLRLVHTDQHALRCLRVHGRGQHHRDWVIAVMVGVIR